MQNNGKILNNSIIMQNKPSFYQCAEKYSSTQAMLGGKLAKYPRKRGKLNSKQQ